MSPWNHCHLWFWLLSQLLANTFDKVGLSRYLFHMTEHFLHYIIMFHEEFLTPFTFRWICLSLPRVKLMSVYHILRHKKAVPILFLLQEEFHSLTLHLAFQFSTLSVQRQPLFCPLLLAASLTCLFMSV